MAIDFPNSPSVNDTHTVNGRTYVWTGDYWKISGTSDQGINLAISDTAPASPIQGDMWFESDTGRTYTYYDGFWVELGNTAQALTTYLADADTDTKVHVEESADEDTIRFDTAGVERMTIGPTGDVDIAGALNVTGELTSRGYRYVDTVYFTSSGTFTKASYPWLRAVRVTVQGGGGGGGHAETTSAGQCSVGGGGGSGTWAQSFITNIASLAASVTVNVGSAGNGGLYATSTAATAGGNSSFGSGAAYEVSADGGGAGTTITRTGASTGIGGAGASGGVGDLYIRGGGGSAGTVIDPANAYSGQGGQGAPSLLGNPGRTYRANQNSGSSEGYGAGGNGQARVQNLTGSDGRDGTAGIVIVELYA